MVDYVSTRLLVLSVYQRFALLHSRPPDTCKLPLRMSTAVESATSHVNGVNGTKSTTKIKSRNQLRRLKAKQKKTEKPETPVRPYIARYMFRC